MDKLAEIIAMKREEVALAQQVTPLHELEMRATRQTPPKGFARALQAHVAEQRPALIAELKKASPSKGLIREDFDVPTLAAAYRDGGAACLSVLTDTPYFQGEAGYLETVAHDSPLPALRKDFIIDPYQVVESRALGADCILLIMAALTPEQAKTLERAARDWGMDVLTESHDLAELDQVLTHLDSPLIGINNRNLKTLGVDLQTCIDLLPHVPEDKTVICESGIYRHADIVRMQEYGVHCFLVGESLMRQADVRLATRQLLGEGA